MILKTFRSLKTVLKVTYIKIILDAAIINGNTNLLKTLIEVLRRPRRDSLATHTQLCACA